MIYRNYLTEASGGRKEFNCNRVVYSFGEYSIVKYTASEYHYIKGSVLFLIEKYSFPELIRCLIIGRQPINRFWMWRYFSATNNLKSIFTKS